MHTHQIEVVDYSDNCSCNDCSRIREMINVEMPQIAYEFDVIDDTFYEVIDYNDTFDDYPVTLATADMKGILS